LISCWAAVEPDHGAVSAGDGATTALLDGRRAFSLLASGLASPPNFEPPRIEHSIARLILHRADLFNAPPATMARRAFAEAHPGDPPFRVALRAAIGSNGAARTDCVWVPGETQARNAAGHREEI
jgi:hypothetical protein